MEALDAQWENWAVRWKEVGRQLTAIEAMMSGWMGEPNAGMQEAQPDGILPRLDDYLQDIERVVGRIADRVGCSTATSLIRADSDDDRIERKSDRDALRVPLRPRSGRIVRD